MELPEEDVVLALEAIQDPVSLFDPVYQSGGDTIYVMDQVQDKRVSEDEWVRSLSIDQALNRLQAREQNIIRQRYFQGRTQMEVAQEIGISQAQVSRLEKSALATMRKYI
jgi:RNA polymerase sporulation-specific sigma factor